MQDSNPPTKRQEQERDQETVRMLVRALNAAVQAEIASAMYRYYNTDTMGDALRERMALIFERVAQEPMPKDAK